jgi:hypothetical protein
MKGYTNGLGKQTFKYIKMMGFGQYGENHACPSVHLAIEREFDENVF